jgi:lipopolysaccharide biosynthesis glycosyltransferase
MKINICFCIDENYVNYLGAVLLSLVETNSKNRIDIYVINNGLSDESKCMLNNLISEVHEFDLKFVSSIDKDVAKLNAGGHISSATYIRFEIPYILENIDKLIYLDADLIITGDLADFWNKDIDGFFVAAVRNPLFTRFKSIGLSENWDYFNAGVMLINTYLWRKFNVKEKALDFLNEYGKDAIMYDQDALNHVFEGNWLKVSVVWNLQTSYLQNFRKIYLDTDDIIEAIEHPKIIHYSSSHKPWNKLDPHPYSRFFYKHLLIVSPHYTFKVHGGLLTLPRLCFRYSYWVLKYRYQLNGLSLLSK